MESKSKQNNNKKTKPIDTENRLMVARVRAVVWAKQVQEVKWHKLLVINKSWRYKAQHGDYG